MIDIKEKLASLLKNKKIIIAAIVIVLIGIKIGSGLINKKPLFTPYRVRKGELAETITVSGNANAQGNSAVYSPATGIVKELYVSNDVWVEKNAELMKIESTALEYDKANAYAAYQTSLSALQTAKQNKILNQSLLETARKSVIDASVAQQQMDERRSTSNINPTTGKEYKQDEVDSINSALNSAKQSFAYYEKKYIESDTAIAAAQSSANAAWLSYETTINGVVKSPLSGYITNLSVSEGDAVIAKTVMSTDPPLMRIKSRDSFVIKIKLSELDVAKVHTGHKAGVKFDAIPDKDFTAIITRLDTFGANANAVVTYAAYLNLQERDDRIKPEMTATVSIVTDTKKNILVVPNTALLKENSKLLIRTSPAGSVKKAVTIGMKNESFSEVTSGLTEGETIYIPVAK